MTSLLMRARLEGSRANLAALPAAHTGSALAAGALSRRGLSLIPIPRAGVAGIDCEPQLYRMSQNV